MSTDLVPLLSDLLQQKPAQPARWLVGQLRTRGHASVDKTAVNRVLYAHPSLFGHDGGTPPTWHSADVAEAAHDSIDEAELVLAPVTVAATTQLYAWQKQALAVWERRGSRGVVQAVTGTGKTMLGLVAAEREVASGGRVLVLVPTIELQRQWVESLKKQLPRAHIGLLGDGSSATLDDNHVVVAVVNSARRLECRLPGTTGLLVADECHRYGAEVNALALKEHFGHRLGLSATFAREDSGHLDWLLPYFGGVVFDLDYRDARKERVIAPFKLALVGVEFSPGEEALYQELSKEYGSLKRRLERDWGAPREPFAEFMKHVGGLSEHGVPPGRTFARKFLRVFASRRQLLAETPAKLAALEHLRDAVVAAARTLVFTESIRAAGCVSGQMQSIGIAAASIDSQLDRDERRAVLERFKASELSLVAAPRVLDEGIDVPAADLGIILAASKTPRQMIQRMGRILRLKADGRLARFVVLFVARTSEDPADGAHEQFLDMITSVADQIVSFQLPEAKERLNAYLNEFRGPVTDYSPMRPRERSSVNATRHALF